jgi:hypothetical protein
MSTTNEYRRDIELMTGWWTFGPYGRFMLGYKHDVTGVINKIKELIQNNDSGFQKIENIQECKLLLKKVRTAVLQHDGGINCNDKEKKESLKLINSFIDEIKDLKAIWTESIASGSPADDKPDELSGSTGMDYKKLHQELKPYLTISESSLISLIEHGYVIPGDKVKPIWKGTGNDAYRFALWLTPDENHEVKKFNDNIQIENSNKVKKITPSNKQNTTTRDNGPLFNILDKYRPMPDHTAIEK